jgi:hypothetical protein
MKVYDVYIEGYRDNGGSARAEYLGRYAGKTFADAAKQACVSRYGEESTKTYFRIRGGTPAFWGCGLYDNFAEATRSFG